MRISEGDIWVNEKINIFKKQIENIKNNREYIYKDYEKVGLGEDFNEFLDFNVEEILLALRKLHYKIDKESDELNYINLMYFYSALISADKISASKTNVPEICFAEYNYLDEKGRKI